MVLMLLDKADDSGESCKEGVAIVEAPVAVSWTGLRHHFADLQQREEARLVVAFLASHTPAYFTFIVTVE